MSNPQSRPRLGALSTDDVAVAPDAAMLAAIVDAQQAIVVAGTELSLLLVATVDYAARLTGAPVAAIALLEHTELVYRASSPPGAVPVGHAVGLHSSLNGYSLLTQETLVCGDSEKDERADREAARRIGMRSIAAVPLRTPTGPVGVLSVFSPSVDHFSADDVRVLELLAGFVAAAVSRARDDARTRQLLDQVQRQAQSLELLERVARAANQTDTVAEALALVEDDVKEFFHARFLKLVLDQSAAGDELATAVDHACETELAVPVVARAGTRAVVRITGVSRPLDAGDLDVARQVGAALGQVTDRHEMQIALRQRREFVDAILDTAGCLLMVLDHRGRVVSFNRECERLSGLSAETAYGSDIVKTLVPAGERSRVRRVIRSSTSKHRVVSHRWMGGDDGTETFLSWTVTTVAGEAESPPYTVWAGSDVTQQRAQEQRLLEQATSDAMTGLPNRAAFDAQLAAAIPMGKPRPSPLAVIYTDLNDFKAINDVHGHAVGDEVLVAVAERLRGAVRQAETVSRLGGDEFAILCEGVTQVSDVAAIVARLRDAVHEPVPTRVGPLQVKISIGAHVVLDTDTPTSALAAADKLMYRDKHNGLQQ